MSEYWIKHKVSVKQTINLNAVRVITLLIVNKKLILLQKQLNEELTGQSLTKRFGRQYRFHQ